ncbi:B3 domain-containing protein REM16-like [Sesamum indicum]|uniref:B3 domain-containing protein REM16-like n=1 Tax=Sesamum indicum TaxID=4182 RepID=A0A6I9TFX0_SESIN|nr:B3 domain-containing protein REM16-like [Sesamum indicum]
MVRDCMDCRKWEEDMYWSRFQTVQFCQVLTGRFDQQLAIPKKFANNLREKMAGTVALKGPSGHEWSVGLVTNGDMLLLGHGWKAFVEDHSLEENDILIFKYNGNSRFEVLMFDQASLCEKTTSYFVKKCEHTESARGNKRGRSLEESFDETNQSPDDVADDHRAKKPRSDAAQTPPSRIQPSRSTSRSRRGIKRGKRGSRAAHPLQLKSRRREVTEEEKQRAQQMAVAETSENSFIVVMRASHVYRGFFMSVPAEWARRHLPNKSHDIELHANGNVWIAKYHYKGYGGGLTGGWKNFVMENFLEESDVCLFDLISGTDDAIILDVKIFRVVEEVIPPSQVMRETSRGTSKRASKFVMDSVSEEDV